ncbi:dithiol-disulfide isomerase [Leptospira perolatii]|uniref:Dithiol-disulfide isomerase n=1 Tax=Leptospira perolatii TaxID=2023191 RepID=A0A2M9ZLZ1_9LEPT|nr:DsbA family oxidoreductase [Leptospira perolatii]PJZ69764.1 dithiol-disulfide isomerase [Leptospira perolatii]PJZ73021.1 dithiol-disulfide isomerase [Leptospira perolatii]
MNTEISIYSDVVCPWCYIGKTKLENAIQIWSSDHPGDRFTIQWKPFELNPHIPTEGEDRVQHLAKKFGSVERVKAIVKRTAEVAKSAGLEFKGSEEGRQPNTLLLHALVRRARNYQKESELAGVFFRKFFSEESDLTNERTILDCLKEVGISEAEFAEVKNDQNFLKEIALEEEEGRNLGITGVPFYIFNDKYAVSGAQESELFLKVFEQLEREGSA